MVNINDVFPSKWLKASDVDADVLVTINGVTMEDVGDDDRKPVVWFKETDKGMVLNKTNSNNIASLYSPETDNWNGRQMVLATAMVDFQGKSMRALRLYPPKTVTQAPNKGGFVSGTPQGDPRGDVPPPASEEDYGAVRG